MNATATMTDQNIEIRIARLMLSRCRAPIARPTSALDGFANPAAGAVPNEGNSEAPGKPSTAGDDTGAFGVASDSESLKSVKGRDLT